MKFRILKRVQVSIIGLTFVLISVGCTPMKKSHQPAKTQPLPETSTVQKVPPPPPPAYFTHTVHYPGETISIIAAWYTKDIMNYHQLQEANPYIDPSRITIGDKIRIPEYLMQKYDPMPKSFVDSFYDAGKRDSEQSKDLDLIPPKP